MNDNSGETELVRELRCSVAWSLTLRASIVFVARHGRRVADVVGHELLKRNPTVGAELERLNRVASQ